LSNQFKPAILQCFGDIAQAIGPHFETYLSVVATVLQQAANVNAGPEGAYDMYDYVTSLREGIMDAWSGIIIAMKQGKSKSELPFALTRLLLRCASSTSYIIRGINFPAFEHHCTGSSSKRKSRSLGHGCYWVSL
jgi:hypothetical protein